MVIAPQKWGEHGKRQVNDKHDAQVICRRLSEYLAGHQKALSIVRIPSPKFQRVFFSGDVEGALGLCAPELAPLAAAGGRGERR